MSIYWIINPWWHYLVIGLPAGIAMVVMATKKDRAIKHRTEADDRDPICGFIGGMVFWPYIYIVLIGFALYHIGRRITRKPITA